MLRLLRLFTVLAFAVASFAQSPKNVILLIGDGMGPTHFTAARNIRKAEFRIGRMPVVGLVATSCADRAITDSAAAATALSTGFKTTNGAIGVAADATPKLTALEAAEQSGKSTGLVTTTSFYDATPAAFAAHAKNRDQHAEIARQMLASGAEVIVGSVFDSFAKDSELPIRELAAQAGYAVATTRAELDDSTAPHILGIFPAQPRDVDFVEAPLPDLAQSAIARLSRNPKGFFLLIEHEGTDSSSHQNNRADLSSSLASFDAAVGVALDFAHKSGDTLVIVTADHETGGLRISETQTGNARLEWSTSDHTAVAVPLFAYGPGSSSFAGFFDNTEVGKKLIELLSRSGR